MAWPNLRVLLAGATAVLAAAPVLLLGSPAPAIQNPPAAGEQPGEEAPGGIPGDLLERLDRLFQKRFGQINLSRFSLEPISTVPRHGEYRRWKAAGAEETGVVTGLQSSRWEVVFLMGSVRNLKVQLAARAAGSTAPRHVTHPIWGEPIHLTTPPSRRPVPKEGVLRQPSAAALAGFEKKKAHQFRVGEWSFEAREVPMLRKECLDCHKRDVDGSLQKLGDPVGIALYGFAPSQPRTISGNPGTGSDAN